MALGINFASSALKKLRAALFKDSGLKDKIQEPHKKRSHSTVFRALLRKKKYLSTPMQPDESVKSLSGEELDNELISFSKICIEIRAKYYESFMNMEQQRASTRSTVPFSTQPIFVTKAERVEYSRIENKNIADIKMIVEQELREIHDEDLRKEYEDIWINDQHKGGPGITKQLYIHFYTEVKEVGIITQTNQDRQDDDEDEEE